MGGRTKTAMNWTKQHPGRWRQELTALRTAGWPYRLRHDRGEVSLRVDYPIPADQSGRIHPARNARLRVVFGNFPWFPPAVFDPHDDLELSRHVNPANGELCLVHVEDWLPQTTIVDHLRTQLPRILAADRLGPERAPLGLENPVPDPFAAYARYHGAAVIVPDLPVPAQVGQGALLGRFRVGAGPAVGPGAIELILGPGVQIRTDAPTTTALFDYVMYGRWLRDPDFDPSESAATTWRRVRPRLQPLDIEGSPVELELNPKEFELIGLLVPERRGYRSNGEGWVFLTRIRPRNRPKRGPRERIDLHPAQYLSRETRAARTPATAALADKNVVVVGLGAIGHVIATDLARTGIGRLDLVDRDTVSTETGRQFAPLTSAGQPKAHVLAEGLMFNAPYTRISGYHSDIRSLWGKRVADKHTSAVRRLRAALHEADVVVDATANAAVTRFLGALRRQAGGDYLVAHGTAGAWGGVVTLLTPGTGCWSCVEHWRADHALLVPAADPDGWVAPARCTELTFTGTNADCATIAHHASRILIHRLAGDPDLGGDYFVANLRDPAGRAHPAAWTAVPLRRHVACLLHDDAAPVENCAPAHAPALPPGG